MKISMVNTGPYLSDEIQVPTVSERLNWNSICEVNWRRHFEAHFWHFDVRVGYRCKIALICEQYFSKFLKLYSCFCNCIEYQFKCLGIVKHLPLLQAFKDQLHFIFSGTYFPPFTLRQRGVVPLKENAYDNWGEACPFFVNALSYCCYP